MALTADRDTPKREGQKLGVPMAAGAKGYAGGIACLNAAGYAVPASTATTLKAVGRFNEQVDNATGQNGDLTAEVERGVFRFKNSAAADEITVAEVGTVAYLVDDETVAKTSGTNTRSRAGFIVDVDSLGVWVLLGYGLLSDPAGALLAANNLSDLAAAATARANLGGGANKCILLVHDLDLVGANAQTKRIVSPVAGDIAKIYSVLDGALTTGDATLTAAIGGVAVTGGAILITQVGSAAGDVDSVTPSAAKTVAVGNVIGITVGGTNNAAVRGQVSILITPAA
ncbi:MAG: hypothetical protein ACYC9M_02965 [Desulfobulbaceae bacterium]